MPDLTDPKDMTIEQHVAWARNSDNVLDVIGALERLEAHSCGPRVFRELASPLILDLREDAERVIRDLPPGDRVKGGRKKATKKKASKKAKKG